MAVEFKLPELGENINEAQVVSINVAQGDSVSAEQEVLEVETDKAVMPVPVPTAGKVSSVNVKEGDTLKVGDVILTIEEGEAGDAAADATAPEAEGQAQAPAEQQAKPTEQAQPETAPQSEPAEAEAPAEPEPRAQAQTQPAAETPSESEAQPAAAPPAPPTSDDRLPAFAAPSVRRFAREIGIDISQVKGTGPGGRISIDDVKNHARSGTSAAAAGPAPGAAALPDLEQFGPVERQAMSMIAKKTAQHMATCWATIPHVTLHQEVDSTDLEAFRQSHKRVVEKAGGKLTPTAVLAKILAEALQRHPALNCAYDATTQEIVYRKYVHIGVAVDTPRGLVVPVLRDADTKSLADISLELGDTAEKARAGKLALEDMQGGCFTLTNLGGIGVQQFTPIVNWPEVGILGVGSASPRLVEADDGNIQSRTMMPLSLSFDHRVVNGADGARFLQWIRAAIEQPLAAFLT